MAKSRIEVKGEVALNVIEKYKADPFERARVIYGIEPRPFQWEWYFMMKDNPKSLGYACPRVGKTFQFEFNDLDDEVCNPYDECLIFAPKEDQATDSFKYQREIIENSEILKALVRRNAAGKIELSSKGVQFINRSSCECIGINSNFEGKNASIIRIEELDDIPEDRLKRALGRGLATNKNGLPTRYRFTGVIWGKLNIYKYSHDENYFTLPPIDIYDAIANGYISADDAKTMRGEMSDDEWLRTMCLKFFESQNFIWGRWLHASQMIGLQWGLTPVPWHPDGTYNKRDDEIVSFGLDMGAQGGGDDASEYSLQITSAIGRTRRFINGRVWPPDSDPDEIIRGVCDWWEFYQPNVAFGDARDANLIVQINEELYSRDAVHRDWKRVNPSNTQSGWDDWAKKGLMAPIHNTGRNKHNMYTSLRNSINNCLRVGDPQMTGNYFVFPYADREKAQKLESWMNLQKLIRELENLVAELLPIGYYKIERYKKKISDAQLGFSGSTKLGDDRTDALAMSNHGLDFRMGKASGGFVGAAYLRGF